MSFTRAQLQSAAKAALEAHPLFAAGRVPVLTNYYAPGERNSERETALRDKCACIEITPVLREKLLRYSRPSLLQKECTLSVVVRITPGLDPGTPALSALTLDTAVDAAEAALLGVGFTPQVPFNDFAPEQELAQLMEDVDGVLSTAIFFNARVNLAAA